MHLTTTIRGVDASIITNYYAYRQVTVKVK